MCHCIPDTVVETVRAWAFILFNCLGCGIERQIEQCTFRFGHKVVAVEDMVNCENMRGEATVPAKHAGGTIKGACENVGDLD